MTTHTTTRRIIVLPDDVDLCSTSIEEGSDTLTNLFTELRDAGELGNDIIDLVEDAVLAAYHHATTTAIEAAGIEIWPSAGTSDTMRLERLVGQLVAEGAAEAAEWEEGWDQHAVWQSLDIPAIVAATIGDNWAVYDSDTADKIRPATVADALASAATPFGHHTDSDGRRVYVAGI
ncbi:MAG: hypothetical protein OEV62_00090 [Actinomycetota bacterium]|nr:hypothetical protein [Actinomycetota bacterium]